MTGDGADCMTANDMREIIILFIAKSLCCKDTDNRVNDQTKTCFSSIYKGFAGPSGQRQFCILRQNAFHFAAKRNPFCGKMQSILRQNAIYFAAKRNLFWAKMQSVLGQNAIYFGPKRKPFWAKMKNHFGPNGRGVASPLQTAMRKVCITADSPRRHRAPSRGNAHRCRAAAPQSSYLCFPNAWPPRWQQRGQRRH